MPRPNNASNRQNCKSNLSSVVCASPNIPIDLATLSVRKTSEGDTFRDENLLQMSNSGYRQG